MDWPRETVDLEKIKLKKDQTYVTTWVAIGNTWVLGRRVYQKNQMVDGLAVHVVQGF